MKKRQKTLADFGDFALRSQDLDEVLTEACRLVGEALGTDLAKILEIEEDEQCAIVRAGIGWKPGVVGNARILLGDRSSEAYSLQKAEPVITPDIDEEERFDLADFLKDHSVKALVNVPIFLPGGKAYGLLQVDAKEPRAFGEEETEFLRTYATILGPVIDRLHKAHDLRAALDDNQRLMLELEHRIKNHIGIIASLVRMRARSAQSHDTRQELASVGERIDTLRLVHEQLYAAKTAKQLRLRPFLMQLVENLCHLHLEQSGQVRLELQIADLDIGPDTAVPLGLIMNEFVTNSLKYAFDGNGGVIAVNIKTTDRDAIEVHVCDDGKGMPQDRPPAKPGSGTGLKLIDGLAHQIGATPRWSAAGEKGTSLGLVFTPR